VLKICAIGAALACCPSATWSACAVINYRFEICQFILFESCGLVGVVNGCLFQVQRECEICQFILLESCGLVAVVNGCLFQVQRECGYATSYGKKQKDGKLAHFQFTVRCDLGSISEPRGDTAALQTVESCSAFPNICVALHRCKLSTACRKLLPRVCCLSSHRVRSDSALRRLRTGATL
jgi:hypothetical protein